MAEIFDLSKARGERDKPNAKYIKHDDFGREPWIDSAGHSNDVWGNETEKFEVAT